jgi:hypothetical protein
MLDQAVALLYLGLYLLLVEVGVEVPPILEHLQARIVMALEGCQLVVLVEQLDKMAETVAAYLEAPEVVLAVVVALVMVEVLGHLEILETLVEAEAAVPDMGHSLLVVVVVVQL